MMTKGWQETLLGEVLTERRETPTPESLESGEVSIVSKIGFKQGKIDLRLDGKTKTGMILIRPGDLVVSGINAAKGAIAIYDEKHHKPIAGTIHYGSYIPNKERVDIKYLWWFLRSAAFREIVQHHVPGGIKTELKSKRFLSVPIPLPSLNEQRRILARVETFAAHITKAQSLREEASNEADILMTSAFNHVFDMNNGNLGNKQYLKEVATIARGKFSNRPRNDPRFYGGDYPFIQIGDISNSDRFIHNYSQTLNEDGLKVSRIFPKGTIVIAITGATIGVTGILEIEACFPDSIVGIISNHENVLSEYIYWALEHTKHVAVNQATQTTQPNMNLRILNELKIYVPPLDEQRRIVAYLDSVQARLTSLRGLQSQTGEELSALLPSVLDKAFKGEL